MPRPNPWRVAPILASVLAVAATQPSDPRRAANAAEARLAEADRRAAAILDRLAAQGARVAAAARAAQAARARAATLAAATRAREARLADARAPLARLLAALETLARRPAALALVAPGSTADLVHTRLALAAAGPAIAVRTTGLRREVAETARLAADARDAVAARDRATRAAAAARTRLAALATARQGEADALAADALRLGDRALAAEADAREAALAAAAHADARRLAADLARLQPPEPGPVRAAPPPAGWRLPVRGRVLAGFGAAADGGPHGRGLRLATMPGALVRAPAPARVAWTGPVRGYGAVVILTHPTGLSTLLAGLARIAVAPGANVAADAPLGTAGPVTTIEVRLGDRPLDVAALAARG